MGGDRPKTKAVSFEREDEGCHSKKYVASLNKDEESEGEH